MSCTFHVLSAATMAVWYDMSLHIFGAGYSRDHPATILRRFCTVSANCLLAIFLIHKLFSWTNSSYTFSETLNDVGVAITAENIQKVALSAIVGVTCTCLLYLGEIAILLISGELTRLTEMEHWRSSFVSLACWRDIIVGPISEEIAFRGCLIAMLRHGCGGSLTFSIVVSSLIFGVAHLHHIAEMMFFQRVSFGYALQTVGFQIGYSSVFGLYASFLFVKTGHLAGPILAHSLCNWLGIPRLVIVDKNDDGSQFQQRLFEIVKRSLLFIYVIGVLLFLVVLSQLPSPQ